jgi:hypothetical protein
LPDRLSKAAAHENHKTLSRLPPFLPEGSSFGSSLTSSAAFLSSLSPRNTGWPSRSSRVHSVNLTSQTIDGSIQGQHFISATVNPESNGAKIRSFWDGFAPGGATGLSPGFQPWEPQNKRVRPHKEHGGITRDVGGGNCALSWLRRLFSCSDRSELIAHLAGGRIEAVEAALLVGLFQISKDTHIKSDLVSDQIPDDSGKLVGHSRNGLGSTQFSAHASVLVAQITLS